MSTTRLDVLTIGNAIVDVIADATDAFLEAEGLTKGSMRLVDAEEAERLYAHMQRAREVSGGCAGNTAVGIAALGGKAGFVGQVADDQLGAFYRHDLTAAGVEFTTPSGAIGVPTARSMILVTPDGHRTMNTFLGVDQPHRPLGQPLGLKEVVGRVGDDVDDRIADGENVEAGGGHANSGIAGSAPPSPAFSRPQPCLGESGRASS